MLLLAKHQIWSDVLDNQISVNAEKVSKVLHLQFHWQRVMSDTSAKVQWIPSISTLDVIGQAVC